MTTDQERTDHVTDTDDTTTDTPGVIDLDAKRAARREGRGDAIEVRNHGEVFRLPIELPADAIEPLAALAEIDETAEDDTKALAAIRDSLEQGLAGLFCNEPRVPCDPETGFPLAAPGRHDAACQWPAFLATRPSLDDELILWNGLFAAYGVSLGEALGSLTSSLSDGGPSVPTSSATTAKTRGSSGGGNRAQRRARPAKKAARPVKAAAAAGGGTSPR